MDLLFRPVFTRVKTPVTGSAPDRESSASTDDNDTEEGIAMPNRMRQTSRVSSYMGFRQATPSIPAPETFPNLRNPENVYHKPSGDQLAEMLKVVMMNQSTMDPVPVQYNSTILHVLEAYQDLRMQLIAKDEAIEVLKQSHTKDIKDFEELAMQWHQKETDYKIEVKKLEVLLSKTDGGMERVAMARSKSVIHGAERASETIRRNIGTIKAKYAARSSQDAALDSSDFGPMQMGIKTRRSFQVCSDRDSTASSSFEPSRRQLSKRNTIDSQPRGVYSQFSERSLQLYDTPELQTAKVSMQASDHEPPTLTKSQLEALERQQAQEFGVNFESSTSGADSSSLSHHSSDFPLAHNRSGLGLGILEKPLPEIPISAKERARQTTLGKFLNARQYSYSDPNTGTPVKHMAERELGFSFHRGDDEDLLARRTVHDRAQRKTVDEYLDHHPSQPNVRDSESNVTSSSIKEVSRRPRLATIEDPKAKLSPAAKPSQLPRIQDHDQLGRVDSSSSSIVTAVRDNSGRSSANNSQVGRPKLNRNAGTSGSGEAVSAAAAAARAYAASNKRPSNESSRKGSGSGEMRIEGKGIDSEGSQNTIASAGSSVSGVEAGKGKKIMGRLRMLDKS